MTIAIYQDEIITWDFLPRGQTMNGSLFLTFLQNVLKPVIDRRRIRNPIILMDNARVHFTENVQTYIREQHWMVLPHPPIHQVHKFYKI